MSAAIVITDAMVDAYLTAQRRTVEEADRNFGRPNVGGLHTNTVRGACRAGLEAALAATGTPQVPSDAQIEDLGVQFGCAVDVGVLSGNRTITWYGGESFGARHMEFARALVTLASQGAAPASECDSPKLCAVNKGCAGQYGTKRVCSTPAPGAAPTGGDAPAGASTTTPDGYAETFYELAALMGLTARPESPAQVWRDVMLPRLRELIGAENGGAA